MKAADPAVAAAVHLLSCSSARLSLSNDPASVRAMMFACARLLRTGQAMMDRPHASLGQSESLQALATEGVRSSAEAGNVVAGNQTQPSTSGKLRRQSTRSGFLLTLNETIGPIPCDRTWCDEWVDLNVETARLKGYPIPSTEALSGDGKFSVATKLRNYQSQLDFKASLGWACEDSEAHVALSGVCTLALAASVQERSSRFAASVHALYAALARASELTTQLPGNVYWFVDTGTCLGLAVEVDARFATLSRPDVNGYSHAQDSSNTGVSAARWASQMCPPVQHLRFPVCACGQLPRLHVCR